MISKKDSEKTTPVKSSWFSNWGEMDKIFDSFRHDLEKSFASFPSIHMPQISTISEGSCDIVDEGNYLKIKMNVPGVQKKDIKLNVTDNSIEISAEHKDESEEKKKNYLRKERSHVSYFRTLPLSEKIVSGKTKAKLTDGILEITLPKSKPTKIQKKKSISIQ
jgi:HSP20 family protein